MAALSWGTLLLQFHGLTPALKNMVARCPEVYACALNPADADELAFNLACRFHRTNSEANMLTSTFSTSGRDARSSFNLPESYDAVSSLSLG